MQTLTQQQSNAINNTANTHNYEASAIAEYNAQTLSSNALCNKYTQLFESSIQQHYTTSNDVGGIILYYNATNNLIAYYDYENFCGTLFNVAL